MLPVLSFTAEIVVVVILVKRLGIIPYLSIRYDNLNRCTSLKLKEISYLIVDLLHLILFYNITTDY